MTYQNQYNLSRKVYTIKKQDEISASIYHSRKETNQRRTDKKIFPKNKISVQNLEKQTMTESADFSRHHNETQITKRRLRRQNAKFAKTKKILP